MKRILLVLPFLLLWGGQSHAQTSAPTEYVIKEGGQTNVFLDDSNAQVHLLLRPGRLVFAFPAENSGVGMWFQGGLEVIPGSLHSLPGGPYQSVEARFRVTAPTRVSKVVLDSIRTLRDESEGAPTAAQIEKARVAAGGQGTATKLTALKNLVRFTRHQRFLPTEAGDFGLDLSPAHLAGGGGVLLEGDEVTMRARLPFPAMTRFSPEQLYTKDYLATLKRGPGRLDDSLRALEFLTRREKMMAGSWRFLTYFGRDTLISLAMLEPILSDDALTSGIRSVLERLSPEGMVAHEEDIGPWAEWRHLQNGQSAVGLEPVYDQKMIDDDFLLPVLLAKLQENGRGTVVDRLLEDPDSRRAIRLNADYVLGLLAREKLVRLNPGESTGDWRDSREGLGGGVFPVSVNSGLALPTLDALEQLYGQLKDFESRKKVSELRPAWQTLALQYWVDLSADQVRQRMEAFASTLDRQQRVGWDKLVAARADLLKEPFRFPVLSKRDDGSAVVVPNTDVAFTLFYGHPSQGQVEDILTLLERPFPYGLATPAGHLVASPVFSTDPELYRSLGFGQYHGLVVWAWPSAMLQFGLLRQRDIYPALGERVDSLTQQIRQSELNVGPLATSELWAIGLDQKGVTWRAYGVEGDQAESNAMQLWSTVYPALEYVRAREASRK